MAQNGTDERVFALERHVRSLAEALQGVQASSVGWRDLEAIRTEFHAELGQELEHTRGRLVRHCLEADAHLERQVHELAERIAETSVGVAALISSTEAMALRIETLESDVGQGIARLTAMIEAHEAVPVGKYRARNLRQDLHASLSEQLGAARAAVEGAVEQRIGSAEASINRSVERLDEVGAGLAERISGLERETGRLAESLEAYGSDVVRRAQLEEMWGELQARAEARLADLEPRLTQPPDTAADPPTTNEADGRE